MGRLCGPVAPEHRLLVENGAVGSLESDLAGYALELGTDCVVGCDGAEGVRGDLADARPVDPDVGDPVTLGGRDRERPVVVPHDRSAAGGRDGSARACRGVDGIGAEVVEQHRAAAVAAAELDAHAGRVAEHEQAAVEGVAVDARGGEAGAVLGDGEQRRAREVDVLAKARLELHLLAEGSVGRIHDVDVAQAEQVGSACRGERAVLVDGKGHVVAGAVAVEGLQQVTVGVVVPVAEDGNLPVRPARNVSHVRAGDPEVDCVAIGVEADVIKRKREGAGNARERRRAAVRRLGVDLPPAQEEGVARRRERARGHGQLGVQVDRSARHGVEAVAVDGLGEGRGWCGAEGSDERACEKGGAEAAGLGGCRSVHGVSCL